MKAYMKQHGDTRRRQEDRDRAKGHDRPAPDVAKRLAQELVTRDNVDILVGFGLTPNALAVAPVATEAKKPMIIMNAATSIITTKSPYIVARVDDAAADHAADGALGREERHQEGLHGRRRLRPRARRRSGVQQGVQGGRRRDGRQRAHAAAESGLRARSSSASRTPSPKRCSCSCRRASRASPS